MTTWPASPFPQVPLADGFREELPQLTIRSPMDVGPAKARRRATAGVTKLTCTFRLSTTQRSSLSVFWSTDLQAGSLPFQWVHPVTSATLTNCRIVEAPVYEPVSRGLFWNTSMTIEILP